MHVSCSIRCSGLGGDKPQSTLFDLPVVARTRAAAVRVLGGKDAVLGTVTLMHEPCKLHLRQAESLTKPIDGEANDCFMLHAAGRLSCNVNSVIRQAISYTATADLQYLPAGMPVSLTPAFLARYLYSSALSRSGTQTGTHVHAAAQTTGGTPTAPWITALERASMQLVPRRFWTAQGLPRYTLYDMPVEPSDDTAVAEAHRGAPVAKKSEAYAPAMEIPAMIFEWSLDKSVPTSALGLPRHLSYANMSVMEKTVSVLADIFEQRPIWHAYNVRLALWHRDRALGLLWMRAEVQQFRRLLCCVAYYIPKGPFRQCWVRVGVDPRIHPWYCVYQRAEAEFDDDTMLKMREHVLRGRFPLRVASFVGRRTQHIFRDWIVHADNLAWHERGVPDAYILEKFEKDGVKEARGKKMLRVTHEAYFAGSPITKRFGFQLIDVLATSTGESIRRAPATRPAVSSAEGVAPTVAVDVTYFRDISVDELLHFARWLEPVREVAETKRIAGWVPKPKIDRLASMVLEAVKTELAQDRRRTPAVELPDMNTLQELYPKPKRAPRGKRASSAAVAAARNETDAGEDAGSGDDDADGDDDDDGDVEL